MPSSRARTRLRRPGPWQPGRPGWHSGGAIRDSDGPAPGRQYYDSESNHGLTGTGAPGHRGTARRDWRPSHCTARLAGPDSGSDSGDAPSQPRRAQAGLTPSRNRDPGRARSDGPMTVTPLKVTGTTRRLGWSEPRPGPTRRGPASLRGETHKNITEKYLKYRGRRIIAGRAGLIFLDIFPREDMFGYIQYVLTNSRKKNYRRPGRPDISRYFSPGGYVRIYPICFNKFAEEELSPAGPA